MLGTPSHLSLSVHYTVMLLCYYVLGPSTCYPMESQFLILSPAELAPVWMVEFKRPSGANMTQDLTHYRREIIAYVVFRIVVSKVV